MISSSSRYFCSGPNSILEKLSSFDSSILATLLLGKSIPLFSSVIFCPVVVVGALTSKLFSVLLEATLLKPMLPKFIDSFIESPHYSVLLVFSFIFWLVLFSVITSSGTVAAIFKI